MEKERLAEHLERYHSGASNAATSRENLQAELVGTSRELECAFGIKGKELRDAVNALRREGVPIASNGSGYFYAATEQEVRATIAHLTHRIGGIAAAIRGLTRSLDVFDTAQTRLPLEGGDGS
jgi:biotin operon repressor